MKQIGLIAGLGQMPVLLGKELTKRGKSPIVIDLCSTGQERLVLDSDRGWAGISKKIAYFGPGQVSKIIDFLHQEKIKEIVMIGKVPKEALFKGLELDERARKILSDLKEQSDEAIMLGIIKELEKEKIKVASQTDCLTNLFPEEGVLTKLLPDSLQLLDIAYGMKMAKEIAMLNIGQMAVVKNRTVLAVEAIEGTDETILRGGKLGGESVVVAKVSKLNQDLRFDVPVVGLKTIEAMKEAKAKVLSIEAGKVFLINKEEVIEKANEYRMVIFVKKLL